MRVLQWLTGVTLRARSSEDIRTEARVVSVTEKARKSD